MLKLTNNVSLRQLRWFRQVAIEHSFAVTARRLRVAPSALSAGIKQLEHALGVQLFERTTRRVELTLAGREFLADCDRILAELDTAVAKVRDLRDLARGQVTVAAMPSVMARVVLPAVKRFAVRHPGVGIQLTESRGLQLSQMVRDGECDFGIAGMFRPVPGVDGRPLLHDRLGLIARPDDPLLTRRTLTWSHLDGATLIGLKADTVTQALIADVAGAPDSVREPRHVVGNNAMLADLVRAQLGVAVLSAVSHQHPALKVLGFRVITGPVVERQIMLQTRTGGSLTPAAAALLELVEAEAREFARAHPLLRAVARKST